MAEYAFSRPADLDGASLRDELDVAGFPDAVFSLSGEQLRVELPRKVDPGAIGAVVSAHRGMSEKWRAFYRGAETSPAERIASLEAALDLLILDSLEG